MWMEVTCSNAWKGLLKAAYNKCESQQGRMQKVLAHLSPFLYNHKKQLSYGYLAQIAAHGDKDHARTHVHKRASERASERERSR